MDKKILPLGEDGFNSLFSVSRRSILLFVKLVAKNEMLLGCQGVRPLHNGLAPDLA